MKATLCRIKEKQKKQIRRSVFTKVETRFIDFRFVRYTGAHYRGDVSPDARHNVVVCTLKSFYANVRGNANHEKFPRAG